MIECLCLASLLLTLAPPPAMSFPRLVHRGAIMKGGLLPRRQLVQQDTHRTQKLSVSISKRWYIIAAPCCDSIVLSVSASCLDSIARPQKTHSIPPILGGLRRSLVAPLEITKRLRSDVALLGLGCGRNSPERPASVRWLAPARHVISGALPCSFPS
jgi:hypothetical protein